MPLYRRLPKRGFNNARFKKYYAVINVGTLEEIFDDGSTVNEEALRDAGLIKGQYAGLKILGQGEVKKKFTIEADRVSASAKEKIEGAGGQVKAIVAETTPAEEPPAEEPPAEEPPAEEPPAEEPPAEEPPAEEPPAEESEEKDKPD
jgi:large subunit ribosomal protein L15